MSFTSINFFVFILVTIILYYILPKKIQWVIILVSSYIFYMFSGIKLVGFLLFTTITTFLAGIIMGKLEDSCRAHSKWVNIDDKKKFANFYRGKKKIVVGVTLFLNFSLLFLLKYYNFFSDSVNSFFDLDVLPKLNILLPLGISFYMFQSIGYVIDVYRRKYEPDKNLFKFMTFVSFFPQLIQGPISRYDNLAHQIYSKHKFDFDNFKYGITFMLWGYFKKAVIADRAVVVVNYVFDNYIGLNGAFILIGVIFYCIQLYCDFSGGIDITRGISKILGIDLAENFRRPYYATSLSDFWKRWHITLGSWMKDYLFYPISLSKFFGKLGKLSRRVIKGNLGKILPTSLATFIVFFAIGIWHGGSDKYIFFGLWNGVIITLSILLERVYSKLAHILHINLNSFWWHIVRIIRTGVIVCIGRYFTRAASLAVAFEMLKNTVLKFQVTSLVNLESWLGLGLSLYDYIIVIVSIILVLVLGAIEEKGINIIKSLEKKNSFIQGSIIFISLIIIIAFGVYRGDNISAEFIYKQF